MGLEEKLIKDSDSEGPGVLRRLEVDPFLALTPGSNPRLYES
jgi:hypothetical protein